MLAKKEIRKKYKQARLQFSAQEIYEMSNQIAEIVSKSTLINFQHFHIFLSIEKMHEVNTQFLIRYLQLYNKCVYIPVIDQKTLKAVALTSETILKKSSWNISEPDSKVYISESIIEVVFVPLLQCDFMGNRVGYGKGFYDNFLLHCNKNALKVGLNFFQPLDQLLVTESHDIPLDYLVTPERIVSFLSKDFI